MSSSSRSRSRTDASRSYSQCSSVTLRQPCVTCLSTPHFAGNHAGAVALAAKLLGVKAHIVIPEGAPRCKVEATRGYGGEVVHCEPTIDAREATTAQIQTATGAVFIPPCAFSLVSLLCTWTFLKLDTRFWVSSPCILLRVEFKRLTCFRMHLEEVRVGLPPPACRQLPADHCRAGHHRTGAAGAGKAALPWCPACCPLLCDLLSLHVM